VDHQRRDGLEHKVERELAQSSLGLSSPRSADQQMSPEKELRQRNPMQLSTNSDDEV
jgi:hypothetical protein